MEQTKCLCCYTKQSPGFPSEVQRRRRRVVGVQLQTERHSWGVCADGHLGGQTQTCRKWRASWKRHSKKRASLCCTRKWVMLRGTRTSRRSRTVRISSGLGGQQANSTVTDWRSILGGSENRSHMAKTPPVVRSSIAPIVQQGEGGEGPVHVGPEAQRAVPEVVPAALVQEDHLNTSEHQCTRRPLQHGTKTGTSTRPDPD